MTAETKVVNYTAEQTETAKAEYAKGTTIEAIAEMLGKTPRSIIAKLSKEDVYKSKAKEAGKREMLKAEMVAKIALALGKTEEQLESLEKATSSALKAVMEGLE